MPVRAGAQASLLEVNDAAADYGDLLVNLARHEVKQWRLASYPNTTRVTKELLTYWFLNPERENRLFFAQREAIEEMCEFVTLPNPNPTFRVLSSQSISRV